MGYYASILIIIMLVPEVVQVLLNIVRARASNRASECAPEKAYSLPLRMFKEHCIGISS